MIMENIAKRLLQNMIVKRLQRKFVFDEIDVSELRKKYCHCKSKKHFQRFHDYPLEEIFNAEHASI